jgi:AcrR family transcriptional regulator
MRLFWRKGFSATSISDLKGAMGIGSPSLYAAFGSKEELYVEALRRFGEIAHPLVWSALKSQDSALAAIEAFLLASAAALPARGDDPGGCMLTLSAVGSEGCAALGHLVEAARVDGLRRLEERIGAGRDAGELSAESDVSGLARFFLAVQQGMSVQARDGASREELEKIARAAVRAWPGCGTD